MVPKKKNDYHVYVNNYCSYKLILTGDLISVGISFLNAQIEYEEIPFLVNVKHICEKTILVSHDNNLELLNYLLSNGKHLLTEIINVKFPGKKHTFDENDVLCGFEKKK